MSSANNDSTSGKQQTAPSSGDRAEAVTKQFALVGLVVLLSGTAATESYYSYIGVRYFTYEVSTAQLLYRGLTLLKGHAYVALPYGIAALWLAAPSGGRYGRALAHPFSPFVVAAAILVLVLPMSWWAGLRQAKRDLADGSSRLPTIVELRAAGKQIEVTERTRLLRHSGDEVIYFNAVPGAEGSASRPHLFHLGGVDALQIKP